MSAPIEYCEIIDTNQVSKILETNLQQPKNFLCWNTNSESVRTLFKVEQIKFQHDLKKIQVFIKKNPHTEKISKMDFLYFKFDELQLLFKARVSGIEDSHLICDYPVLVKLQEKRVKNRENFTYATGIDVKSIFQMDRPPYATKHLSFRLLDISATGMGIFYHRDRKPDFRKDDLIRITSVDQNTPSSTLIAEVCYIKDLELSVITSTIKGYRVGLKFQRMISPEELNLWIESFFK